MGSLRVRASLPVQGTSHTHHVLGNFSLRPASMPPLPRGPQLFHRPVVAQVLSLEGLKDFAIVQFNEIFPGLLHCCLVHKKLCFSLPDI